MFSGALVFPMASAQRSLWSPAVKEAINPWSIFFLVKCTWPSNVASEYRESFPNGEFSGRSTFQSVRPL